MKIFIFMMCVASAFNTSAWDNNESIFVPNKSNTIHIQGVAPTTNYDETLDGDFGDRLGPTPVNLLTSSDRFIGNVGGTGVDFDDCFIFTIPVTNSVTEIVFENYIPDGGNPTTGFNIYTGSPPNDSDFGDIVSIAVGVVDIGTDFLAGLAPLSDGEFTICMLEGTPNQGFSLVLNSDFSDLIFANSFEPSTN